MSLDEAREEFLRQWELEPSTQTCWGFAAKIPSLNEIEVQKNLKDTL